MARDKEWNEKRKGSDVGMAVAAFPFLMLIMIDGATSAVNDFLIDHIGELGTHRFPLAILMLVAMTAGSVIGWKREAERQKRGAAR